MILFIKVHIISWFPQPYEEGQIQKGGRRDADSDFVREGDMKIM